MTLPASPLPASTLPDLFRDDIFRIETRRLWLRWPKATDARAIHRFASLPEVAGMTATWPLPLPEQEVERRILKARQANADGRAAVLAIVRKCERERVIGQVGLHLGAGSDGETELGLGFMLDPEHHNRGYMTEAVRALIGAVLPATRAHVVRGSCRIDNPASRRVFEKVGFEHTGDAWQLLPARGVMHACHGFELTRERWRLLGREHRRATHAAAQRDLCCDSPA